MILGDRGEVLHVNPAAQSVLDRADGLTVRLSRLTADCARAAVEIRTAVANALGRRDSAPAASAVVCPRPHGRAYILHVTPQCSGEAGGHARATVIVIDPQRRAEPPASLLRRLFGLTAAEADISIRLVHGAELSSIAEELTVSITTVRTQSAEHLRQDPDTPAGRVDPGALVGRCVKRRASTIPSVRGAYSARMIQVRGRHDGVLNLSPSALGALPTRGRPGDIWSI